MELQGLVDCSLTRNAIAWSRLRQHGCVGRRDFHRETSKFRASRLGHARARGYKHQLTFSVECELGHGVTLVRSEWAISSL